MQGVEMIYEWEIALVADGLQRIKEYLEWDKDTLKSALRAADEWKKRKNLDRAIAELESTANRFIYWLENYHLRRLQETYQRLVTLQKKAAGEFKAKY